MSDACLDQAVGGESETKKVKTTGDGSEPVPMVDMEGNGGAETKQPTKEEENQGKEVCAKRKRNLFSFRLKDHEDVSQGAHVVKEADGKFIMPGEMVHEPGRPDAKYMYYSEKDGEPMELEGLSWTFYFGIMGGLGGNGDRLAPIPGERARIAGAQAKI
jgi:hypothetical protein